MNQSRSPVSFLLLLLLVVTSTPAWSGPSQQALAAFKAGQYATAIRLWQPLADKGEAEASFHLSLMYDQGLGVPRNQERAVQLLQQAAERGHVLAQHNLGNHYEQGAGVERDIGQAARWWMTAAMRGFSVSQYNIGVLYLQGRGMPQNQQQAISWFEKAAAQGNADARRALRILRGSQASIATPGPARSQSSSSRPATQPQSSAAGNTAQPPRPAAADQQRVTAGSASPLQADRRVPESRGGAAEAYGQSGRAVQAFIGDNPVLEQGHRWLLAQQPEHYTLQIFASNERASILHFLDEHRFDRQVAVYAFSRHSVSWFGVVYGRFDTVREAHLAVEGLPASVRRARPWVRAFKEIQPFLERG